jgi:hypothetical protein
MTIRVLNFQDHKFRKTLHQTYSSHLQEAMEVKHSYQTPGRKPQANLRPQFTFSTAVEADNKEKPKQHDSKTGQRQSYIVSYQQSTTSSQTPAVKHQQSKQSENKKIRFRSKLIYFEYSRRGLVPVLYPFLPHVPLLREGEIKGAVQEANDGAVEQATANNSTIYNSTRANWARRAAKCNSTQSSSTKRPENWLLFSIMLRSSVL